MAKNNFSQRLDKTRAFLECYILAFNVSGSSSSFKLTMSIMGKFLKNGQSRKWQKNFTAVKSSKEQKIKIKFLIDETKIVVDNFLQDCKMVIDKKEAVEFSDLSILNDIYGLIKEAATIGLLKSIEYDFNDEECIKDFISKTILK